MFELKIWTDGDFGLRIAGCEFYYEDIKVWAAYRELLLDAVRSTEVLMLNDDLYSRACKFLTMLQEDMETRYEGWSPGGNWSYFFNKVAYDLELGGHFYERM